MRKLSFGLIAAACLFSALATPAASMTNGEVLDNMEDDHLGTYIAAMVSMAAYQQIRIGSDERGNCMYRWFFRDEADGPRVIHANMDAYRDHATEAVILLLLERACPE